MRRLAAVSMMAVGLALFVPGWAKPAAASSRRTILPPTSVKAVSIDGGHDALVTWQPLPAGGPRVLYYIATTYNRQHTCQVAATGPYSCVITGLLGNGHFLISVQAVTTSGVGPSGRPPQSTSSKPATTAASTGAANAPVAGAISASSATLPSATSASSATVPSTTLTDLPFTGIDLPTLLLVGFGLVASGLLLVSSRDQYRRARRRLLWWMFGS